MKGTLSVAILLAVATSAAACQSARPTPMDIVPAVAPDTLPAGYRDRSNWITDGHQSIIRDVVLVGFKPGTSQRDRSSAIRSVNGAVIGGQRVSADLSLYVVKVPAGGSPQRLRELVLRLLSIAQVGYAEVDYVDTGARPVM